MNIPPSSISAQTSRYPPAYVRIVVKSLVDAAKVNFFLSLYQQCPAIDFNVADLRKKFGNSQDPTIQLKLQINQRSHIE
jgi:hypothetical protein